jgi:hypothetical protein
MKLNSARLVKVIFGLAVAALAIWLGLPRLVTAFGVHPHYTGPRYQLPGKSVLIITTSHDRLGDGGRKTGVFASEMTAPYYEFLDGGMSVDIASIKGGQVPIDPLSFNWIIESAADKRFKKDEAFRRKTVNSLRVADVDFTKSPSSKFLSLGNQL